MPHPSRPGNSDQEVAQAELQIAAQHAKRLTYLAYAGVGAALIALTAYFLNFHGPLSDQPDSWGQFGDYLGGVLNPTFSFLALIALLATFSLQVRELRISAQELKNSADALIKQNETLRKQAFEATFFQMLSLHNEIVNATLVPSQSLSGRACFKYYIDELEGRIINTGGSGLLRQSTKDPNMVAVAYDDFYEDYGASLGHYFRLLYNIVKFIDASDTQDKKFYTNLVRAQLSSAEVKLIFYNCLTHWGADKFKPLVERYALLKTIPTDRAPSEALFKKYSPSAFGGGYPSTWDS